MLGAVLAVALVISGLAWLAGDPQDGRARDAVTLQPEGPPVPAAAERDGAAARDGSKRAAEPTAGAPHAADPVEPPPEGRRRGVLRGDIELPSGVELAGPWTVRLERSHVLRGAEIAVPRQLERPADARDFRFDDLPLAGYDVVVESDGFFSRRLPVLLVEGAADVYVVVAVERTGWVEGRVLDEDGGLVEDLEVALVQEGATARRTTRTRADGTFRIDGLVDGRYVLSLGNADVPYAEPVRLAFDAPSLDVGTLTVPKLHVLVVRVVDQTGRAVAGARVRGLGSAGGVVDASTDARGELRVPLLVAGEYRLRAEHDEAGRVVALESVSVGGNEPAEITLELVRP